MRLLVWMETGKSISLGWPLFNCRMSAGVLVDTVFSGV
jgi:hypothetical protein